MQHRQIPFVRQLGVPVLDRGVEVGMHRLDLFVADEIVVELKAVRELTDVHFAVVRSYLRATHNKHGLILNFAKYTLEAKRVVALQTLAVVPTSPAEGGKSRKDPTMRSEASRAYSFLSSYLP